MNVLFIVPFLFNVTPYPVIQQLVPSIVYADELTTTSIPEDSRPMPKSNKTLIKEAISQYCSPRWQDVAISINKLESNFNPKAIGDGGHSYGAVQINLPSHPTISKTQAQDIDFSEQFLCTNLENGKGGMWSTFQQALIDN